MAARDRTQLLSRDGVPRQHGSRELQRVEDRQDVIAETIGSVAVWRRARIAKAASCDPVNVMRRREHCGELVEHVRGVAQPGQEDQRSSGSTKIEHFQLDVLVDRHELNGVRGGIFPRGLRCGASQD